MASAGRRGNATPGDNMRVKRSILIALLVVLIVYVEIHSCSDDSAVAPEPPGPAIDDLVCLASDVFFLDDSRGWVVGSKGTVMRTVDGGVHWTASSTGETDLNNVQFIDPELGWAVGEAGRIFRSIDGGATWERAVFSGYPMDTDLYRVRFLNDSLGFVLGYYGVFRTDDGGMLWQNNWLPVVSTRGAWDMSVINESTAYLIGTRWTDSDPYLLWRSEDGGITWTGVEGSRSSVLRAVLSVSFVDRDTGWVGGGVVMKTTDGGGTWTTQLEEATVRRFFFLDRNCGFAVGGTTIIRTTDGGDTWVDVSPVDDELLDLRNAYFLDRNRGWAVGRFGIETVEGVPVARSVVMKTTDGGETWETMEFLYDCSPWIEELLAGEEPVAEPFGEK